MNIITFFNNKGGVGKTSMVYHLSWMMRELGHKVLAVDLDPQSNLTSAFLPEDKLELLWPSFGKRLSILGSLEPLINSLGDINKPELSTITTGLWLLPGDLGLSTFEDRLSNGWSSCLDDNPATSGDGFRVMTAFYRVIYKAAEEHAIDYVLVDVGPNVGAMNRAVLVASDYVVIPLGADLFSLQGLQNLGPTLRAWRKGWNTRRGKEPSSLNIPRGTMQPIGYVLLNPSVRSNRPVKAYLKWASRIPELYHKEILSDHSDKVVSRFEDDPNMLSQIKHFKSLMPMAQDVRKPMFLLRPADGAIGGHGSAVQHCHSQFKELAFAIKRRVESAKIPCTHDLDGTGS